MSSPLLKHFAERLVTATLVTAGLVIFQITSAQSMSNRADTANPVVASITGSSQH
ncbi:MAG TPA: hypothetical protein V6D29_08615 [Leptolyngbyaceae cyanobacterium]